MVIQLLDTNYQVVWAKTSDGEIFYNDVNCRWLQNCWIITNGVPSNLDDHSVNSSSSDKATLGTSCEFSSASFQPKELKRGKIVQCMFVPFRGVEWYGETNFVLIDEGTVWMRTYQNTSLLSFEKSKSQVK